MKRPFAPLYEIVSVSNVTWSAGRMGEMSLCSLGDERVSGHFFLHINLIQSFSRQIMLKETYVAAFRFGREQRVQLRYLTSGICTLYTIFHNA